MVARERRLDSLASLTAAVFRANAFAWVGATYHRRFDGQFVAVAHRAADAALGGTVSDTGAVRIAAASAAAAVEAVTESILAGEAVAKGEPSVARNIKARSASDTAEKIAVSAASYDYTSIWEEVRVDANKLLEFNPSVVMVGPLWSRLAPQWSETAWVELTGHLRSGRSDVWVDWYEQRLLGGTRGENSELLFAAVPAEIWDSGLAAASSWITAHLPRQRSLEKPPDPDINDAGTLEAWLSGQTQAVTIAIAARAALRVVPLIFQVPQKSWSVDYASEFLVLIGAVFRACAVAWVSASYPDRLDKMYHAVSAARATAGAAASFFTFAERGDESFSIADTAARASSEAAAAVCVDTATDVASAAAMATSSAADALGADFDDPFANTAKFAAAAMWREVRADCVASQTHGARTLADLPLWEKQGSSPLTKGAWTRLHEALPEGEDWEVWIDWYENRLRGALQGEAYELVFATVPLDVWDRGPAAANAWIRQHAASGGRQPQAASGTLHVSTDRRTNSRRGGGSASGRR